MKNKVFYIKPIFTRGYHIGLIVIKAEDKFKALKKINKHFKEDFEDFDIKINIFDIKEFTEDYLINYGGA